MSTQVVSNHVNAQASGIVHAHAMYGQPVQATAPENMTSSNIRPAFGSWSTAPYVGPEEILTKVIHTARRCHGNEGTCKGFPMKDLDYCSGHARSLGLVQNWNKNGRMDGDAAGTSGQGSQPDGDD